MSPFKKEYAELYDSIYAGKDYTGEAAFVESLIRRYRPAANNILDYGCGTANHAAILAGKGYRVYGVDKNRNMLALAKRKLEASKNVIFYHLSERKKIKPGSIDICVTLFDVLSYMNTDTEITDFLRFVKKVLAKKGLFIFDFWYGPGVRNLKPVKRRKTFAINGKNILRVTAPLHDRKHHIVNIAHRVTVSGKEKREDEFTDKHDMRYFFADEIKNFLKYAGFKILKFGTWKNPEKPPTASAWSALVVARNGGLA